MHATGANVGGMHAEARGALVKHHELFALFKPPERRRQGAHVHGLRSDIQEMGQQAADFRVKNPDELGPPRHCQIPSNFSMARAKACSWFMGAT